MRALNAIKFSINIADDNCKEKGELKNVRTWSKNMSFKVGETSKTGLEIINMIYKAKAMTSLANVKLFRAFWSAMWTVTSTNEDYIKNGKF